MRKILGLLAALLASTPALADWTAKNATPATITFKNPQDCTSVACVPQAQLYDGTNQVTLTTAGANGASNTLTGLPTYSRLNIYNGTTWDRWTGAVTMASGAVASGAVASGAIASGALAAGAGTDGWDVTQGAKADSVCGTATGTCSMVALVKFLNNAATASTPAGTNIIGKVGIDQTTDGTTNLVAAKQNGTWTVQPGNTANTTAWLVKRNDGTNSEILDPCQVVAKTNFTGSQTAGTQVIAGTSAKKTYICSMQLIVQAAEIVNIIAGTGTVCATGSSAVMGSTTAANGMSYAANGGFTLGSGVATVIAATAANADNVCITQSGSSRITYQGTYVQL